MVRRARVRGAALLALVLPVVAAVALPTALAQTASFSLSWQAPAECPDESHVRRAVEQLLGEGPPPPANVSARAVVEHTATGHWNVRLTTVRDGVTGERVVESESCQSLADATALILALAIDPQRVAARGPGAASAPASSTVAPATPSASASAPTAAPATASVASPAPPGASPTPAPASTPSAAREAAPVPSGAPGPTLVALFAQVGGDVGTLPRAAFALGAGAALTLGSLRVEGYGTYLPQQATYAATLQSLGTNIHLLAGGLRGCFVPLRGSLEAGGCVGLELGDLRGQGFGPSVPNQYLFTPSNGGGLWVATTLSGRASWRIARSFALVLDVGLVVPLRRDLFEFENPADPNAPLPLHEAGPVEGRAAIGPEVRF
jgi:hypothetical protein